jgi:hypothetical protein
MMPGHGSLGAAAAAIILALTEHGLATTEIAAATTNGTLPGKIGAELEAFDISGIEVMELLRDDYFVEILVAEGGRKGE